MIEHVFAPWLLRWGLKPDGEVISTPYSQLLPVLSGALPAMLKLAIAEEERRGAAVMEWYGGQGAAFVLALEGEALLLERLPAARSLSVLVGNGFDDEATRIICGVVRQLHAPRDRPYPPSLVPLETWFRALFRAAGRHGGILRKGAETAINLISLPREQVVLHGDIHHENILDGGPRGWLAIDPKGLFGERGFDYANIFLNPDRVVAAAPGRLMRQAEIVAAEARLDLYRLLQWILAYACLSAAWLFEEGGGEPKGALAVAELAAEEVAARWESRLGL